MNYNNRFSRKTLVFLDGDQGEAIGCLLLPGGDAPERVVFNDLKEVNWRYLWTRVNRDISDVADGCERAMTLENHHDWVNSAANHLRCGGDVLWSAMCGEWAAITNKNKIDYIEAAIAEILGVS